MFLLEGDAKYIDILEQILYNGYLSGVSLSGDRFFYQNPLESDGSRERSVYFEVACCPANVSRLMAQLPALVYAESRDALYVNLFVSSRATIKIGNRSIRIVQETRYPWDGLVKIELDTDRPAEFSLRIRIPGWARNELIASDLYRFASLNDERPQITINGRAAAINLDRGFAQIRRVWKRGDTIELRLPMPARRALAHEGIQDDRGKAALMRGPLVYCVEAIDNGGRVDDISLPLDAPLSHQFRRDLLGGVEVITAKAMIKSETGESRPRDLVAIPYYAWANRGKGEMAVWLRY
jgi:DUF1680 family protein